MCSNKYITELQEKADAPLTSSTLPAPVSDIPPALIVTLPTPSTMTIIQRISKHIASTTTDRNSEESTVLSYNNTDGKVFANPSVNDVFDALSNLGQGKTTNSNFTQSYYSSKQGNSSHEMQISFAGHKAADGGSYLQVPYAHVKYYPKSIKDLDGLELKLLLEKCKVSSRFFQLEQYAASYADVIDVDPYLGGIATNSMNEETSTGDANTKQEMLIKNECLV